MAQYIDKSAVMAEIDKLVDKGKYTEEYDCAYCDGINAVLHILKKRINTLDVKEVDLEDSATHYLLHKHTSPLSAIMHQADLKSEMQYHKDIEDAYKAGFEFGLLTNNKDKSFEATVCKVGNTYLKEMDKDAIAKALESYKDGDKVKVIIIKDK